MPAEFTFRGVINLLFCLPDCQSSAQRDSYFACVLKDSSLIAKKVLTNCREMCRNRLHNVDTLAVPIIDTCNIRCNLRNAIDFFPASTEVKTRRILLVDSNYVESRLFLLLFCLLQLTVLELLHKTRASHYNWILDWVERFLLCK